MYIYSALTVFSPSVDQGVHEWKLKRPGCAGMEVEAARVCMNGS